MTNVIVTAHDAVPPREIISQNAESSQVGEIQTDAIGHQRAGHLIRRLRVVLLDLGLDGMVPNDWVEPSIDGLSFSSLSLRQADQLVRALEDLATDYEPEVSTPGPDQLSLFEDGLQ